MFGKYKSNVLSATTYHSIIGIYPTWVGYLTALQNYECKPRVLDDYFMIYVSSGRGHFACKGRKFCLEKSDVFFLFPGIVHWYKTDPEQLLELWWIGFNGPNSLTLLSDLGIGPENPVLHGTRQEIPATVKEIVDDMMEIHSGTVLKASGNLYKLFGQLMNNLPSNEKVKYYGGTNQTMPIEKALTFIDANYSHDITIEQIARQAGLSRSHFTTRFKAEVGFPPSEHLARMRLKQAKHYLENSNIAVKEIAYSVGFKDPQYFSRFFHQSEGVSPTEYRNIAIMNRRDTEHGSKTAI